MHSIRAALLREQHESTMVEEDDMSRPFNSRDLMNTGAGAPGVFFCTFAVYTKSSSH